MILRDVPSLNDILFNHYLIIEEAISSTSIEDIIKHYAKLHGVESKDISEISLWSNDYCFGERNCCPECTELEDAIAANIAADNHKELVEWFPLIAKVVKQDVVIDTLDKHIEAAAKLNDKQQEKINIRFVELMKAKHGDEFENFFNTPDSIDVWNHAAELKTN